MNARPVDEPVDFTAEEMRAANCAYRRFREGTGEPLTDGQFDAVLAYWQWRKRLRHARRPRPRKPPGVQRAAAACVPIDRHPDVDRCPRCGAWRWAGTCSTPHEIRRSEVRTVTEPGRSVAVGQHDGPGAGNTRAVSHLSDVDGRGQA